MSAAVIILNWNGEKLLREFLPSVVANTPASVARVVVADNGSTDGSVEWLKREFPQVELLQFPENLGYAGGYNKAIGMVDDDVVVLLNSDVETPSGWLQPMLNYLADNPGTAACQPKILSYTNRREFEYAGACGGFLDRNGYPFCRGRIFSTVEEDNGQYDTPMEIFWASGAALVVRRDVYLQCGGLDEAFFAHMEEIDLCWRIRLAGYKIAAVPQSIVYHLGGGSLPASNPRKTYLNFRNNLLLLHKNLPVEKVRGALLRRRLLDTLAWAMFVVTLDWKNAAAVWRAHRHFARMRKNYHQHPGINLLDNPGLTLPNNPDPSPSTKQRHTLPNIITAYYLRRLRHFSSLK